MVVGRLGRTAMVVIIIVMMVMVVMVVVVMMMMVIIPSPGKSADIPNGEAVMMVAPRNKDIRVWIPQSAVINIPAGWGVGADDDQIRVIVPMPMVEIMTAAGTVHMRHNNIRPWIPLTRNIHLVRVGIDDHFLANYSFDRNFPNHSLFHNSFCGNFLHYSLDNRIAGRGAGCRGWGFRQGL